MIAATQGRPVMTIRHGSWHGLESAAVEVTGTLASGLGEGGYFMAIDWVVDGVESRFGFRPYPGTLNLVMRGAAWCRLRSLLARSSGIELPPHPGNCGAKCFRVMVEERHPAVLIVPDVPGYPDDKFEIVAPVALRPLLAVADGGEVRVSVLPE